MNTTNVAIRCEICGEPITAIATAYRKMTGWAKPRDQGGPNALALPERLDEWAHASCVDLETRGIHRGQQKLV